MRGGRTALQRVLAMQGGPSMDTGMASGLDYEFREVPVAGFPQPVKVRKSLSAAATKALVDMSAARVAAFAFTLKDLSVPCKFPLHEIVLTDPTAPCKMKPYNRPKAYEMLCAALTRKLVEKADT